MGAGQKIKNVFKRDKGAELGEDLLAVLPEDRPPWYRTKHLLILNLLVAVPLFTSASVGFDGSMMNGLQALPQWRDYFGRPRPALLGVINAVYPLGKLVAVPIAGWLADRYGRKTPFLVGLIIMLIGPAIQAASHNLVTFVISRAIIGFATTFSLLPSPILVTELAHPTQRSKITALFNTMYFVGAIIAAWSTYGTFKIQSTWAWRIPSMLQALLPTIQLVGWFFLPESPRWCIANEQPERARAFFVKHHCGGEDSPLADFEMQEIIESIRIEKAANSSASWYDLVRTPANRKRSIITVIVGIFAQWNGIAVVSYYLTLVLNSIGITSAEMQTLINGLLQVFNFMAAVFGGAMMVDRLGRRTLFLLGTGGMLVSYICWTFLTSFFDRTRSQAAGNSVVAFIFITYFFYDIAWTPLPQAYTVEIYPYTLRSRGMSLSMMCSFLGLISSMFLNPIGLGNIGWRYYIVFCVILGGLFTLIWFLFPETKGHTLEEIREIFEGPLDRSDLSPEEEKRAVSPELIEHPPVQKAIARS